MKLLLLMITLLISFSCEKQPNPSPTPDPVPVPTPTPLPASGTKIDLFKAPSKLKGANIYAQEKYSAAGQVWNPTFVSADFSSLRSAGATLVNMSVPGIYDVKTYKLRADFESKLDHLVSLAAEANLYIIISFRTGPGRGEGNITGDGYGNKELFSNASAQAAFVAMWKHTAMKYKDNPKVVGYDLLVEPHDVSFAQWRSVAQPAIDAIRSVDASTPILVNVLDWAGVSGLADTLPMNGTNLVYAIHQYEPYEYTHNNKGTVAAAISALDSLYSKVQSWAQKNNALICVNELGVKNSTTDGHKFIAAHLSKLDDLGLCYAAWIWEEEHDPDYSYDAFDFKDKAALKAEYLKSWNR